MTDGKKFRLVTRADFDGLVCAVLLKERGLIEEITFVHPKDMQDGKVPVDENVISTNLPYVEGCHLVFDHHASELRRLPGERPSNHIFDPTAPSAARVVWDYYGGREGFPDVSEEMMWAVDRGDAGLFTEDEILEPHGWVLLNFVMDSRTGLGRFRRFRISNFSLMMQLIDHCRNHSIEEILALPDVAARVELYRDQVSLAQEQLHRCATAHGDLVTIHLRDQDVIHPCNRFMVYALFRGCNISMHVMNGPDGTTTVFAMGKSILNRTSDVDIGRLALEYGGGGHPNAGTCQVPNADSGRVLDELTRVLGSASPVATPAR
jgi:nanoRNase/pAp phosphatase (c-di-AMP/oligoRNAs hydrolase)